MTTGKFIPKETTTFKGLREELENCLEDDSHNWIFRGQPLEPPLQTYLERAIIQSGLNMGDGVKNIESEMIRDFRRHYDGDDREYVLKDTLYCLSLLQHHGAPTRLMDWTYSKYVAIYNAIESAFNEAKTNNNTKKNKYRNCAVWCLNTLWCDREARESIKAQGQQEDDKLIDNLGDDKKRIENPEIFDEIIKRSLKFAIPVNPFRLHGRLYVQRAVSLCPGNVGIPFEENLKMMRDYNNENSVKKITCTMNIKNFQKALRELWEMNISRASLYPGFDGLAQSMKFKLSIYKELYDKRKAHGQKL